MISYSFQATILVHHSQLFKGIADNSFLLTIKSLTFKDCKFSLINSNVFKDIQSLNELNQVIFLKPSFEDIQRGAFDFNSPNVSILIQDATREFDLNQDVFGSSVNSLTIKNVVLSDFSTEQFLNMSHHGTIEVIDSSLKGKTVLDRHLRLLRIKSLKFRNVLFDDVYKSFLNVSADSNIIFHNCSISLKHENLIEMSAPKVIFQNSELQLGSHDSLKISTDLMEIRDCVFNEPQQRALNSISGFDGSSTLVMKNISLKDPAKGTFLTKFLNLKIDDIFIDSCECNVIRHLACPYHDFEIEHDRFSAFLDCEEIQNELTNSTYCMYNATVGYSKIIDICPNKLPLSLLDNKANQAVVGGMVFGFVIFFIIIGAIGYKWHLKHKEKREFINKWRGAYPATTVYR